VHLLLVGASHRTASVELRERLDFSSSGLDRALGALATHQVAREAAIVSTCNRAEIYVVCDQPDVAREELVQFMGSYHHLPASDLRSHLYAHTDGEAARHLFRVASGLDSLVVGEPQILGQVKDAYAAASTAHTSGPVLNKLFHAAFGAGKRVRSETSLTEGAVSVSFAAVTLARKIFGQLSGCHVLVLGAGEMSKLTATHLKTHGIAGMTIASRTRASAEQLAAHVGGKVIDWDHLAIALREADIVITSTGASRPIIDKAMVQAAVPARRARPLFMIDIAVPRDVAPDAGDVEQVFLYNIDDLQAIVRENLERRGGEVGRAEGIVDEELQKFIAWQRSRGAIPTVVALRQRFEAIRKSELQRLEPKLAQLPPEARERVEEITRLLIEKLLIQPTEQLKAVGDPDTVGQYSETLGRLFGLSDTVKPGASSGPEPETAREAAPAPAPAVKDDKR
jgi:glutamyl-tRNA reductase